MWKKAARGRAKGYKVHKDFIPLIDFKSPSSTLWTLLPHLNQKLPEVNGQQSQHDTECRVENEIKEFLIPQQHEVLVHERGKGREPTAQSHGEEQAQVPV